MNIRSEQVSIGGDQLFVHLEKGPGNRPCIVFLHDSLGSVALWRDFPQQLAAATGCDVLVYDRRGYGRSEAFGAGERTTSYLEQEADKLAQLLGHFGIDDALLFGHSDGGSIALIAAAKYPARIRGVVAEAAHIFVEEETLAGIRAAVSSYRDTDLRARLTRYHGEKTDVVFRAWTETWLRADFRSWNIWHFLPLITCPVLVIQGTGDEYGTEAQVQGIASGVSGPVEIRLLPGTGHTPHREARDETLAAAAVFIRWAAGKSEPLAVSGSQ
ncbi:MAG: alpha/beta hydrolase [Chitinophagaceae bacterium]|nr:MAG: alpha/beta hydrolase [Chitinophagaceae bacterium]